MDTALIAPNAEVVRQACEQFDRENEAVEQALSELFSTYPANNNTSHVLLKVVALNSLYSTRILAVLKVARHISDLGAALDAALAAGSPEAVDLIAPAGERDPGLYSFATKYCNWQKPQFYPIYDSRVDKYLWLVKKQGAFSAGQLAQREDLADYRHFCDAMIALREQFGLGAFSFKEIDKYLWSQGEAIWAVPEEEPEERSAESEPPLPEAETAETAAAEPAADFAEVPAELQTDVWETAASEEETLEVYKPDAEVNSAGGSLFLDRFPSPPPEGGNGAVR